MMYSIFAMTVIRVFMFLLQIVIKQYMEMKIKREAIINRIAKK